MAGEQHKRISRNKVRIVNHDGTEVIVHTPSDRARQRSNPASGPTGVIKLDLKGLRDPKDPTDSGVSFRDFKGILSDYGFSEVKSSGPFQVFREKKSGAVVVLPQYRDADRVRPVHVNTFKKLVAEKGLADNHQTIK